MNSVIDCVVVGYHEVPLQMELDSAYAMQGQSGHLYSLLTNTVEHRGQRMSYLDLINTVAIEKFGADPKLHVAAMPNLGVSYLRHQMEVQGLTVDAINFFDYERDHLEALLTQQTVSSVAITTTFYTSDEPIRSLVAFIRRRSPRTRIIVGGPHILNICSYYGKDALEYTLKLMGADYYIFDSQGEATLVQLVHALRYGPKAAHLVPNLYILGDSLAKTERRPESNPLETQRINWKRLPRHCSVPTVMTRTARSCAFKCSFCTYPVLAGKLSLMGVEAVTDELDELAELGTQNLSFIDDTFNVPPDRFKAICRMMIERKYTFRWFSYLRCGNIDEEGLDLLAESGCAGVFLGIESGDSGVLANMNKKADADRYRAGIIGLRQRDVPTYASIIVGFPGETEESLRRTSEFLQESRPTFFHPEMYCHYQFSPVNARAAEFGLTGNGYSWSHNTMNWNQAQDGLVKMIQDVSASSTYLPTYSFDFWALPYLYGRGLSRTFVEDFLRVCNENMLGSVTGRKIDDVEHERRLSDLIRARWGEHPQFAQVEG